MYLPRDGKFLLIVTLSTYAHFLDEDEKVSADCIDNIFSNKKADNN